MSREDIAPDNWDSTVSIPIISDIATIDAVEFISIPSPDFGLEHNRGDNDLEISGYLDLNNFIILTSVVRFIGGHPELLKGISENLSSFLPNFDLPYILLDPTLINLNFSLKFSDLG